VRRVVAGLLWCRECGALRVGEGRGSRWSLPGLRPKVLGRVAAKSARVQLRLIGVDEVACPDCASGRTAGYVCGFCDGAGTVSVEVAQAIRFSRKGEP